jgi:pimeloyl-ACP methyl ester carboxylesterase
MTLAPIATTEFSEGFKAPHRRIETPRGTLAYYRFGAGPDVVAVHGWPLHAATFRHVLPHLTRHFTVHLFDLPGTGATAWREPASFSTNVDALRRGIDALGLSRYALLAHDSGAVFARHVAAADRRVAGLAICGSEIPGHHPWLLALIVRLAKWRLHSLVLSALRLRAVRHSVLGFGACFTDPAYTDGEFAQWFLRPLARPSVLEGQMQLARSLDFADVDALAAVHARIAAPTLCIWGDRDPYFPIDKARAMLPQFAGGATLVTIPGGRLFPHEDRAEEFAAYARPFLAECLGQRGADARAAAS